MNNIMVESALLNIETDILSEKVHGLDMNSFITVTNIARELAPLNYSKKEIMDVWKKWRTNNWFQDQYRLHPEYFKGFDGIVGMKNIVECVESGGIFATFHYGNYRYVFPTLSEELGKKGIKYDRINLLVDRESYESEQKLTSWQEYNDKYVERYVVAEEGNSGLSLLRSLRKGQNIFLYLDGNTGSGEDSHPIDVKHLTSNISMRSGIFRLIALLNRPLCVLISDTDENGNSILKASQLFTVEKHNLKQSIEEIYSFFTDSLKGNPHLWRFWYRHHNYVIKWADYKVESVNYDFFTESKKYAVSLLDGMIYQYNKEYADAL